MSENNPQQTAPASQPTPATGGGQATGGGGETPAQQLARLKAELEQAQSDNAALDRKIDNLKSTVAELGKAVAEIEQKAKGWEQARKLLIEQRQEQEGYYKTKRQMLEATVPDKEAIARLKQDGDEAIKLLRDRAEKLREEEPDRVREYAKAQIEAAKKQRKYDAEVNLAKRNEAWLKELAALHADAEKEDEKGNISRMYFLILEMEDVLKKIDTPSVEQFTKRVNDAQTAAAQAAVAEQQAKDKLAQAQADLKKAEKDLADAEASRRKNTLAAIPEEAAAPAPA